MEEFVNQVKRLRPKTDIGRFYLATYVEKTDYSKQYFTIGKNYLFAVTRGEESLVTIDDEDDIHPWNSGTFIQHFKLISVIHIAEVDR